MVVSDHSPCPPELKRLDTGDFSRAWGGIGSLQLGLAATWTGARHRGFGLENVAAWMCENPAKLAGIGARKGRIAAGTDADLVVFDPEAEWVVRGADLQHRHKLTPYDGMTLRGVVKRTILRGKTVFDSSRANPFPTEPIGRWIKRDQI
jgi:allantoinase